MREDEAFIDAPGDDTPRLVYADWLDDRSDPRGSYLRAEREAVETGEIARLRELAVGLDPVWVARVSMPPVGVCCDGFAWSKRGSPVSHEDVARFEARFGVALPPDYRAFLLNYNGGVVDLDPWETPGGIEYCAFGFFNSLANTTGDDPPFSLEYEYGVTRNSMFRDTPRGDDHYRVRLRDYMIVANSPGHPAWILLGTGKTTAGRIRSLAKFPGFEAVSGRPRAELRFDSFPEYLLFLRNFRL